MLEQAREFDRAADALAVLCENHIRPDQITQGAINLRPPRPVSGFPTPEHFEASAMLPQNGLRSNYRAAPRRFGQSLVINLTNRFKLLSAIALDMLDILNPAPRALHELAWSRFTLRKNPDGGH